MSLKNVRKNNEAIELIKEQYAIHMYVQLNDLLKSKCRRVKGRTEIVFPFVMEEKNIT